MSSNSNLQKNNTALERILNTVNELPNAGGGVSVQPDWNQTDETAADFIKNKPFGDVPTVILEEQELAFDQDLEACVGVPSAPIQAGDFLSISADGESYECEVVDINGNIAFGNLAFVEAGEDTGEPFLGFCFEGVIMFVFMDELNHTVKITNLIISKLDPKYVDTNAVFYIQSPYIYTNASRTTKATKAEVVSAIKKKVVVLEADGSYFPVVRVDTINEYVVVYCITDSNVGAPILFGYTTAEYTPPTT